MGPKTTLESYFSIFRQHIIGVGQEIPTPYHKNIPLVYADWTASGRNYHPIEQALKDLIMPWVANTHTDTNHTGMSTTYAYHKAQSIIKDHVGAQATDVLIASGSGMTGVINKFQRILGMKIHESFRDQIHIDEENRPVVFVTHMEHHSNQTSWLETTADVVVVPPNAEGLVDLDAFEKAVKKYSHRKRKIAAVTSCSNVTGIMTPYSEIAQIMHRHGGFCFVDFACSGPYVDINMHPGVKGAHLDAIYFSPHKFLGGPGSSGLLLFNKSLYQNTIPDHPGGGTVDWTNPWGEHKYVDDIEAREDGGTPAFLQTIKAAMCMQLKDQMGVDNILQREKEQLDIIWAGLTDIPNLHILAEQHRHRLGVISFYIDELHYLLGVKLLNDKFGIQTRGGCSCAGTYGHYLLEVDPLTSHNITDLISSGNCSSKPGWIRMSIHPTLSNREIHYIVDSIQALCQHYSEWVEDYDIDWSSNRIKPKCNDDEEIMKDRIDRALIHPFLSSVNS